MISVTWMTDAGRSADFLECRNELPHFVDKTTVCNDEIDIVKVYFYSKFDVDTIKGRNLERTIARTIFLNRAKYGDVVDAALDVYPNAIHFRTGTDAEIYNEYWPINLEGAEK